MVWERNIGERWDVDKYRYQMNNRKGVEGGTRECWGHERNYFLQDTKPVDVVKVTAVCHMV